MHISLFAPSNAPEKYGRGGINGRAHRGERDAEKSEVWEGERRVWKLVGLVLESSRLFIWNFSSFYFFCRENDANIDLSTTYSSIY